MPSTAMLTALVQCLVRVVGVSKAVELAGSVPGLLVNTEGQVLQYDHAQVKMITRLLIECYEMVTAEVSDGQAVKQHAVGAAPTQVLPVAEPKALPTRLLIVGGHALVRESLARLLDVQVDLSVVGQASTLQETARAARELRPEVVLLDLALPDATGDEGIRLLRMLLPDAKLILLAPHDGDERLFAGLAAGASGYLLTSAPTADLLSRLRALVQGEVSLSPATAQQLLNRLLREKVARVASLALAETLSAREVEILQLVAQGHTNRQIATALGLSIRTVETYRASLMSKVGVNNRADLVRFAAEHGLVRHP